MCENATMRLVVAMSVAVATCAVVCKFGLGSMYDIRVSCGILSQVARFFGAVGFGGGSCGFVISFVWI